MKIDDLTVYLTFNIKELTISIKKLFYHIEYLLAQANHYYKKRDYPLSTFFSIITIEEIGKYGILLYLMDEIHPKNNKALRDDMFKKEFFSHSMKLDAALSMLVMKFNDMATVDKSNSSSWVAMANKFDRISKKAPKYLNSLKQKSLYFSQIRNKFYLPSEVITQKDADHCLNLAQLLKKQLASKAPTIQDMILRNALLDTDKS